MKHLGFLQIYVVAICILLVPNYVYGKISLNGADRSNKITKSHYDKNKSALNDVKDNNNYADTRLMHNIVSKYTVNQNECLQIPARLPEQAILENIMTSVRHLSSLNWP